MEFKIRDTGIGMSKEFLDVIYEPFTQEKADARSTYKGTGLGMSIVKRLVDAMKGEIDINSIEGRGTTVIIRIPFEIINDYYNENNEANEIPSDKPIENIRVLLVEDNELNAEIADELLKENGAIVDIAENGKVAIDKFMNKEEFYYDCILMDIRMPILNGIDATRIIRSLNRRDSKVVPIFALTADAFLEDVAKVKEAGMNEHFAKPLNIQKIIKAIRKYCIKESLF